MRVATGAFAAAACAAAIGIAGATAFAEAPLKHAAPRRCQHGMVAAKVGGRASCVARRVALPAPSGAPVGLAAIRAGLAFTQASVTPRHRRLGSGWGLARRRLLAALATVPGRIGRGSHIQLARQAAEPSACALADLAGAPGALGAPGTYTTGGVSVSMGLSAGGMQLGLQTTAGGDTYTLKYSSGEVNCLAYVLPPCPTAAGNLDAHGIKASTGYSLTVTRAGQVLSSTSFNWKTTVETKGLVAADAKLDTVEVRYQEVSSGEVNGVRFSDYGNRTVTIDMRTDSYGAGDSFAFGSASAGGQASNTAGQAASAEKFAAFVGQTIANYHARESAWQTPGTCAKLTFDPGSGTLDPLDPGATGQFSAKVIAAADGGAATKAQWTLGSQQDGEFSPSSSSDAEPTISYAVSTAPTGNTISVAVKATSSAGVAQDTWTQKLNVLNTITGSFSGHEVATDDIVYDWTGTVTFTRVPDAPGAFQLSAGQATITVSGTSVDTCTYNGSDSVSLPASVGVFTILAGPGHRYQILAPFGGSGIPATASCPGGGSGPTTLGGMAPAALQSGDTAMGSNPSGLIQTSSDGIHFVGSATENDSVVGSASWTWNLTGSP